MKIASKLFLILLSGLPPEEVQRFLQKSRVRLISAKEKAQNLPHRHDKAVLFISNFQDAARRILYEWITENIVLEETVEDDKILEHVKLVLEEYTKSQDSDTLPDLYRQILFRIARFGEDDPINSQIIAHCENVMLASDSRTSKPDNDDKYFESLCQVALGEAIGVGPNITNQMSLFIKGIEAVRAEDVDALNDILKELESDGAHHRLLSSCREKLLHKNLQEQASKRGLIFTSTEVDEKIDIDPEDTEWLCRCNGSEPKTSFHDAIGYIKNHVVTILSEYEIQDCLPDEGTIIAYSNMLGGYSPNVNEIGGWRVKSLDTDRRIKFAATSHSRDVFEVIEIPFNSKAPDNVRYWLENNASTLVNKPIFLLNDNILIKPAKDQHDLKRLNFNEPFSLWYSLPAFKAWGKKLILGPLPTPEGHYDCGEVNTVLKKALRHAIEQDKWPKMTSAQIQQFVQFITDDAGQFERWQIERIIASLQQGVTVNNDIQEVVAGLMKLEAVQAEIAQGKQKILNEYQQEQSRVRADLDRLRQEQQTLQSQVNAAKQDARQLTSSLSQAIMKSFESAKEKGIATLADTALFQALLGQAPTSANGMVVPSGVTNTINPRRLEKLEGSFEDALKACGLDRTHVRLWKMLATLAVKHRFVVTFKGFAAGYTAQAFSSGNTLAIDTPLGLMQGDEFDRTLEQQSGWDALIVYNVNRIPLDVLGSKLEEITLGRWLQPNSSEKTFLCTLAQGESSFPVTDRYRYLGPIFDLEKPAPAGTTMPDLYEALTEANSTHNIPKIWIDKMTALIDEAFVAAPEDKKAVLGLIQHAFIPPHVINTIAHSSNAKTGGSVVSIKPL